MTQRQQDRFYRQLGRKIRERRVQRSLSQDCLGSLVDLTRTSFCNLEAGRQRLLLHKLLEIAEALAIPVTWLLPGPQKWL